MIRLVGPGGAGKSTIGALLAERLDVRFIDLDRHLAGRV
jgi:shikimate kinase